MGDMPENKHKKPVSRRSKCITIALLAHVDAGKTTLSEALLYLSGAIKDMGRGRPSEYFSGYSRLGTGERDHDFFESGTDGVW